MRFRTSVGLVFLLTAVAAFVPTFATDQCGAVCDVTWTAAANPHVVTCDVTVAAGCTLDIEAGAEVRFQTNSGLIVDGDLNVNGASGNTVTITSDAGSPSRGDWDAIEIRSGATASIDWADIAWATDGVNATGAMLTIADSTLRESSLRGVYLSGGILDMSATDLTDNTNQGLYATNDATFTLDTVSATGSSSGIYAEDEASGTIAALSASSNTYGVYVYRSQTTATTVDVTGSTLTGNSYGFYIQGVNSAAWVNPEVTITASSIFDNSSYDLYTQSFFDASSASVSASGNWWGTTEASAIAAKVYDRKNSASSPVVDWCQYLDGPPPTGTLAHGLVCPDLAATCDGTESWSDTVNPYLLTSVKTVCPTGTLEIGPDVEIRSTTASGIRVEGTLDVNGTVGNPVTLTTDSSTPARGSWNGLVFLAGSTGTIDGADIAWATDGINATGAMLTIADSTLRESSLRGVYLSDGMLDMGATDLTDNTNQGLYATNDATFTLDTVSATGSSSGIYAEDEASGTIAALSASSNTYGVYVYRSQTTATTVDVTGSTLTGNSYGFYIQGVNSAAWVNPEVTITASSIFDNSSYDLYTQSFFDASSASVSASGNWWGTTEASAIAAKVYDRKNSASSPVVDWCQYLDGPPPTGTLAHGLVCPDLAATCDGTESWSDTVAPYLLTSVKTVCPTGTLEIGPDVEIRSTTASGIRVEGTLDVNGTVGNPVTLTTDSSTPARGSWNGLVFLAGSTGTIDGADIAWATDGVNATGAMLTIADSTLRESSLRGVYLSGGILDMSATDLTDNTNQGLYATNDATFTLDTVSATGSSSGIYAEDEASGTIAALSASSNTYGVYVYRSQTTATTVDVTGSTLTGNSYGFYIQGVNSAAWVNPEVTITASSIFDNSSYDLYTQSFFDASSASVSASGNWWGTTEASAIAAKVYDRKNSASSPVVDWCQYLDGPPPTGTLAHGLVCPDLAATCDGTESWSDTVNPYLLTSVKTVCPTGTLEIGPDVEVRSTTASGIRVEGTLDVNGTVGNPVTLTTDSSTPARGSWNGLVFLAGSTGTIDGADIAWATDGINATGAMLTIADSTLRESSLRGVYLSDGMLDMGATDLTDNTNQGLYATNDATFTLDTVSATGSSSGIYAEDEASGTIAALSASSNTYGVYVYRSQTTATTVDVTGSTLTGNSSYGLYIRGQNSASWVNPEVTITASSIFDNSSYDLYTQSFFDASSASVSASGNWWGTTEASAIAAKVYDRKNSASSPVVDWCQYLDGPPPTGTLAHGLVCPDLAATCDGTESWSDTVAPYLLTSVKTVCPTGTLEIGPDVEVRSTTASGIRVEGTLDVNGAVGNPVTLTTDSSTPARGSWNGLVFLAGSTGTIDGADIAWATDGINATGAMLTIADSTLRESSLRGVYLSDGMLDMGATDLTDNTNQGLYATNDATFTLDTVSATGSSSGIYAEDEASGTIAALSASSNTYGVYVYRSQTTATTVDVTGSTLTGNSYGFYVQGVNSAAWVNPEVTITASSIFDNSSYDLYTQSFFDAANSVVRAPDNWWGSEQADQIAAVIYDQEDAATSPRVMTRPFGGSCDVALGRNSDSDSVGDFDDNCPLTVNQDQVDADGDGMGDECDPVPGSAPLGACNGIDDVTDGWLDSDGDGWGDPCDFHPLRADSYPDAPELCDGRDNDGDFVFADGELTDLDLDGAVDCLDGTGDCNDADAEVFPCACERCANLVDDDCDGATDGLDVTCPLNTYCVLIVGTNPLELALDKLACGGANVAPTSELIRGSTLNLAFSGGSVDLGNVACVDGSLAWDRATDVSEDGNPACNEGSVFWLARPTGAFDFGTSSDGSPRDITDPDPVCP